MAIERLSGVFSVVPVFQVSRTAALDVVLHVRQGRMWMDWQHTDYLLAFSEFVGGRWVAPEAWTHKPRPSDVFGRSSQRWVIERGGCSFPATTTGMNRGRTVIRPWCARPWMLWVPWTTTSTPRLPVWNTCLVRPMIAGNSAKSCAAGTRKTRFG